MPYKVFEQLFHHPLTDKGLAGFLKDWEKAREVLGDILPAAVGQGRALSMEQFDWRVWAAIGAGVGRWWSGVWYCACDCAANPDDDEIEQKRRSHINQVGRIAEGQILEVLEVPHEEAAARGVALFRRGKKNASANGLPQAGVLQLFDLRRELRDGAGHHPSAKAAPTSSDWSPAGRRASSTILPIRAIRSC